MAVAAARLLRDGMVCFVGIGLPSAGGEPRPAHERARARARLRERHDRREADAAAALDRRRRARGDGDAVVSVPEIFAYWLQAGRIDVGFLGAAQIDRYANLNSTVIGSYDRPEGAAAGRRRRAGDRHLRPRGVRDAPPERRARSSRSSTSGRRSGTAVSTVVTDLGVLEPRGRRARADADVRASRRRRRARARGDRLGPARGRRPRARRRRRPRRSSTALRALRPRDS